MLIKSQVGEFEINVSHFETQGDDLVIVGAMGVWEARTHATPRELINLVGKMIGSRAVWAYVLKLPYLLVKRSGQSHGGNLANSQENKKPA